MIHLIVAAARNGVIGFQNQMPWHLSADLKYFKAKTLGHTVVMGRKTAESLGKPLPGRKNIVITRSNPVLPPGFICVHNLETALSMQEPDSDVFIIGGGQIYQEALRSGVLDTIYLTRVDIEPEGDVFFPELNPADWKEISRECHPPAEPNQPGFCLCVYIPAHRQHISTE